MTEQHKPVGLETPIGPPAVNVGGPVLPPAVTRGELLTWRGWHWVVLETNNQGQILLQLREPTSKAINRKQAEGKRVTRHLKKLRKRERKVE